MVPRSLELSNELVWVAFRLVPQGSIIVDRCGKRAGLRPSLNIARDILRCERARTNGAGQRQTQQRKVARLQQRL